jgi:hypothetical protein
MVDLKYNVREFQKILYKTETYQRASFTGELQMGEPYYFQGPLLRRMSAEQIWDSVVALALPEADRYQPKLKEQLASIDRVKRIYDSLEARPFEDYLAMVKQLAPLVAQRFKTDEANRKALAEAKDAGDDEKFRQLRKEIGSSKKVLSNQISEVAYIHLKEKVNADDLLLAMGFANAGSDMMEMSEDELEAKEKKDHVQIVMLNLPKPDFGKQPENMTKEERRQWQRSQQSDQLHYRTLIAGMARASELPSPAKPGHFLRDFGQSDREVIENASDYSSVPQALNLLNGNVVEALINHYSVFGRRIHDAGTPEEKTRMIFQAMLTRQPTAAELATVKAEVDAHGEGAYEGIVWALLNTQQFLFVQ